MTNPKRFDFVFVRGDTFADSYLIRDGNKTILDLSSTVNNSAAMTLKATSDNSVVINMTSTAAQYDGTGGGIALSAGTSAGSTELNVQFNVPSSDTESWTFGTADYDFQLNRAGVVETLIFGTITLQLDITT